MISIIFRGISRILEMNPKLENIALRFVTSFWLRAPVNEIENKYNDEKRISPTPSSIQ